jgi:glycosyltransferase involved in cell wall biosynthesis
MKRVSIVHASTLHARYDTRIWLKEVATIAQAFEIPVEFHVQDGKPTELGCAGAPSIIATGRRCMNKWLRVTVGHFRMLRSVLRSRPKVFHFHDPELITIGFLLRLLGVKVIYDVHEDTPKQLLAKKTVRRKVYSLLVDMLERLAMPAFDGFVAATPAIARRFPAISTIVVQNFPLEAEYAGRDPAARLPIAKQFCYVGGVTSIRGSKQMIEALGLLSHKDATLVIAGQFSSDEERSRMTLLPGWARVYEAGWLGRQALASMMQQSSAGLVLFQPAPNHMESQPNKLFEYMSAGIPVIASDFPLWRRILSEAHCGLLVDPTDPVAIANAMNWICEHPNEARQMGDRGRAEVEARYNWGFESRVLTTMYARLLGFPEFNGHRVAPGLTEGVGYRHRGGIE